MKVFVFDLARCNGCHNCQIGCKDEHCGNDWSPYALPQPDTGHFWLKVQQEEHGQIPKVRVEYRPVMCNHCDNAPCVAAAPECFEKRADGLVILKPEAASGRRDLVDACPFGHIYYNDELDVAQKCTGCAHLVDAGGVPHCVELCATEAMRFGDEEDFAEEIARAECVVSSSVGPRVYYLNMPKLFIGGEVWDPVDDEVLIGAQVTLGDADGRLYQTQTDEFGDFWFKKLEAGTYELCVEMPGYQSVERTIELTKSLNVGDFPLERA